MTKSKLVYFVVLPVVVCLFSAMPGFSQSGKPASVVVDNLFLAKDDGTGKPGEPAQWFYSTDVPIYVVVMTEPAKAAAITMRFVSVAVAGLKADSKILSTNYNLKEGSSSVWFNGHPFGSYWIAGKYRVEILIDGVIAKSQEFEVRKVAGAENTTTFAPKRAAPKRLPKKHLMIFN